MNTEARSRLILPLSGALAATTNHKIMFQLDGRDADRLRELIVRKEKYLEKITDKNSFSFKATQAEILFLKNDILPIIVKNSSILHGELVKSVVNFYDKAIALKCNGLLLYQPIDENYTDRPVVGVANFRQSQKFGEFGNIEIFVDNMDGMGAKVKPINLPINEL